MSKLIIALISIFGGFIGGIVTMIIRYHIDEKKRMRSEVRNLMGEALILKNILKIEPSIAKDIGFSVIKQPYSDFDGHDYLRDIYIKWLKRMYVTSGPLANDVSSVEQEIEEKITSLKRQEVQYSFFF